MRLCERKQANAGTKQEGTRFMSFAAFGGWQLAQGSLRIPCWVVTAWTARSRPSPGGQLDKADLSEEDRRGPRFFSWVMVLVSVGLPAGTLIWTRCCRRIRHKQKDPETPEELFIADDGDNVNPMYDVATSPVPPEAHARRAGGSGVPPPLSRVGHSHGRIAPMKNTHKPQNSFDAVHWNEHPGQKYDC